MIWRHSRAVSAVLLRELAFIGYIASSAFFPQASGRLLIEFTLIAIPFGDIGQAISMTTYSYSICSSAWFH